MSTALEAAPACTLDAEFDRQAAVLAERSEALALILAVQEGLAAELDTDAIYELVGDRLRDFFNAQAVVIRTFDDEGGLEHIRYAFEKGRRLHPPARPLSPLMRRLIETREPFLWKNGVAAWLRRCRHAVLEDSEAPRSVLTVPMLVGEVVRGAVSLQNVDREDAFDEEDLRLLTALTCSMTQALETVESHDRLRRALAELQRTRDHLLDEQRLRAEAAEALARQLQAENERQVREIEEARRFQLALLPKRVPQLAEVEIAAYMRTATEVGGDYYDFFVDDDGSCLFAIGDATGHGLRAGSMVTVVKSLLASHHDAADLTEVLHRAAGTIRQIALPGLFMAIALGRLTGHVLELVGAGMPAALVHRAAAGTVEEVPLKGVPLGGPAGYPYQVHRVELCEGDTVVLASDGFAELFNGQGDMLGYHRAAEVLRTTRGLPPEDVIHRLVADAEAWTGTREVSDDVTFVVLRAKAELHPGSAEAARLR